MRIDFNEIREYTIDCQNCGEGTMAVRMFSSPEAKVVPTRIHPGGSIGPHKQVASVDVNYVLSGTGIAICDGVEEELHEGICHICPKDSEHSIKNTGDTDLVMLTVVAYK